MFYRKRLEQSLKELQNRNDRNKEKSISDNGLDIETKDIPAMILAAFITFFPAVIVFCIAIYLILWLFLR